MKEPTTLEYIILIFSCLLFALAGLYILTNFTRLFKQSVRNELLRKNIVAWLAIFCISTAMLPMSGGFFYMLAKWGWWWSVIGQFISTTATTLVVYNTVRFIAENSRFKKLSFIQHNALIVFSLIVTTVAINIPFGYILYGSETSYLKYIIINSIYLAGATGLIYAVISYLDIERKRKFDAKELELSRMSELKAKAELDALHSKVNPHFLYNALNSIADLSMTDGKKARKMTIALADLFRYSINYSQNNYSTINDEMAMTEVYMQIEKIRFEDQLTYSVYVEPATAHYLIPRFILQPLAENAVKHGLKATGKLTEIFLEVRRKDNGVIINIADNGPPFPDELVPGYGVKSVFDKLDLLFPGQYEIHFSNVPRKQVSIQINKLLKNEPGL
ncbi:MAG: histidine kinase [Chitinophagaceae bacterium]|nr:histidine kinase [Chitinophagaceae bacterium]